MWDSANSVPSPLTQVSGQAASTGPASTRAPSISAAARGPGRGSIGRRSQVTPPTTGAAPCSRRQDSATASAPTTSPPPPTPITRGRRAAASSASASVTNAASRALP